MDKLRAPGLRTRILLALAVVMTLFILLTELAVSQLVRIAMTRHTVPIGDSETISDDASKEFEKDVVNLRRLVIFYLVTGSALALALSFWALNRLVVRPLSRVNRALEQVAEGKLDTEVPIVGAGELVQLGLAFNKMTTTLREQQAELETRLREVERSSNELREAQDSLIRAARLASVGTLAAGLAHEIGNPLAGVMGLLEALEAGTDEKTMERYHSLMKSEIKRMDRILSDLLAYARPSLPSGKEKQSTTLEEVLENLHDLLGTQRLFDKVELKEDIDGGPWTIEISRDDLTQILLNLLLNAAQAMNGEGGITISAERLPAWRPKPEATARDAVRLHIADTGPGVPSESVDNIFDPFFSAGGQKRGSGLGLAICQSICDRAGGDIALVPRRGPGACFRVTLPAA